MSATLVPPSQASWA
ncbi:hypothetical protein F7Q92_14715 [Ideonella dechloratans]|uniref:Uncharacterized protein n=1 Tax=Ideonella dechloratans TaxID=36863 RepID=A0A643FD75_IDEDE|nr:hypothetical protein F7Q92_14715 [Ideonella dechloratans]